MCSGKVVSTYVTMGFHNFKTWLWKIWGWGVFEENLENMAWRKFPSFTPRIDDTCSKGQKWKCDRCRNICFYKNFWPSNITGPTIFSPHCSTSNGSQTLCQNLGLGFVLRFLRVIFDVCPSLCLFFLTAAADALFTSVCPIALDALRKRPRESNAHVSAWPPFMRKTFAPTLELQLPPNSRMRLSQVVRRQAEPWNKRRGNWRVHANQTPACMQCLPRSA